MAADMNSPPVASGPLAKDAIEAYCTRRLSGHILRKPKAMLEELAAWTADDLWLDRYGEGAVIGTVEQRIAELLGKESGVLMPSGTMAQQIVLRIYADRARTRRVALHPTSHIERREADGYRLLHGIEPVLVGDLDRVLTVADLAPLVGSRLAAVLIELPTREIGGQLQSWSELEDLADWTRRHDVAFHLDGARLWECGPYYGREYAEVAALFDSVYVSLYKALGSWAGAVLCGPRDIVEEAKIWRTRHGGTLVRMFPYALGALRGLERYLPQMPHYHDHAVTLASAIASIPTLEIIALPPPTNLFHVRFAVSPEVLEEAALRTSAETRILVARETRPAPKGRSAIEISVGEATLEVSVQEAVALLDRVAEHARDVLARSGAAMSV